MTTCRLRLVAVLIIALASLPACSTLRPFSSGRMGLLDRLSHDDTGAPRRRAARSATIENGREVANVKMSDGRISEIRNTAEHWQWPVEQVQVTSPFGSRHGRFHEGIDLKAPTGTQVVAAQAGKVVYAGKKIRGYGLMIVMQHKSGLSTVYAHNSKLYVKVGDVVKKGKRISLSGSTGRATGPHLHFEIRDGAAAVNPYTVLPAFERDSEVRHASR